METNSVLVNIRLVGKALSLGILGWCSGWLVSVFALALTIPPYLIHQTAGTIWNISLLTLILIFFAFLILYSGIFPNENMAFEFFMASIMMACFCGVIGGMLAYSEQCTLTGIVIGIIVVLAIGRFFGSDPKKINIFKRNSRFLAILVAPIIIYLTSIFVLNISPEINIRIAGSLIGLLTGLTLALIAWSLKRSTVSTFDVISVALMVFVSIVGGFSGASSIVVRFL